MTAEQQVYEMLLVVVRTLVDKPDQVKVERITAEGTTTFRIQAEPQDIPKLIGKEGRTARSIRTILGAASMRHGLRFILDIADDRR